MNGDTSKLFERVAKKMGWMDNGGLVTAEKKLISSIGKTRHTARGDRSPVKQILSEDELDSEKENQDRRGHQYRSQVAVESSDDEFDQFLVDQATPKAKGTSKKPCSAVKKDSSNAVVVSSDDDCSFEKFLQQVKTPNRKPKMSESGSEDSMKNFIVDDESSDDDFIKPRSSSKAPKRITTPAAQRPVRRQLSQCDSPVFVSSSEDGDDNVVVKSTWRTRHSKPTFLREHMNNTASCNHGDRCPSPFFPPVPSFFSSHQSSSLLATPKRTLSAPSKLDDSASSDEEFMSLLERLKKKNKLTGTSFSPQNSKESSKDPPLPVPPVKGLVTPTSKSFGETQTYAKTPVNPTTTFRPAVSQTEPRRGPVSREVVCKTPGCFLQSLSNPSSSYGHTFKQKKEELTKILYQLYNTSVFDSKLPVNMSVTWNKKMRKTAGYCVTGQERAGGNRYARIELSEKVCDSADRLRDTLIHEMCHAATWLINGVRDGHGNFWKLYARKATVVHPELPMVTRCHSYDITYKYQYQCTRCQNTIGRHSKSLDVQRFVCALCTGQLVLLNPSKSRAPTPFASFVKEHYGSVRQELAGQSHAEVMRKLSADFASKSKISHS
ncbi:germ cell nuclear acidic protein [Aulostomus maculatus]